MMSFLSFKGVLIIIIIVVFGLDSFLLLPPPSYLLLHLYHCVFVQSEESTAKTLFPLL